jgi:enterochelin esterase family protein
MRKLALAISLLTITVAAGQTPPCDLGCLVNSAESYLAGVGASDFSRVASAKDAKFTSAPGQADNRASRPLERSIQSDLTPGASQAYTVQAKPGDLVIGPFNVLRGALVFEVHNPQDTKTKATWLGQGSENKVGFVASLAGRYRIVLIAQGPEPASFNWKPTVMSPAERMAGRPRIEPIVRYTSARITQLEKDVADKVPGALARFWAEVTAGGGPIVEPLPTPTSASNPSPTAPGEDVLVTFLWRQIYDTYSVEVMRAPYGPANYRLMTHLGGTDVWYRTMKLHRSSRLMYRIAPNHRGDAEDGDVPEVLDPLNPRVFPQPEDRWLEKAEIDNDPAAAWGSVLSLPGAPDETWARRTPSTRGTLQASTFDSPSLKARLTLHIYTPPGYDAATGPHPLVVLFDGVSYAKGINAAPTTLDNLIADGRIRAPIACFVDSTTDVVRNRGANLTNPAFTDAIARELIPWLRSSYTISADPKDLVIGGYSAGAVAGARAALAHSNVFGNVLAQSGGAAASAAYIAAPRAPVRFYIDMGLYELTPGDLPFDEMILTEGMTAANRRFRDVLLAKGYDVTYRETGGDHSPLHWRATLAEALMTLLPPKTADKRSQ